MKINKKKPNTVGAVLGLISPGKQVALKGAQTTMTLCAICSRIVVPVVAGVK